MTAPQKTIALILAALLLLCCAAAAGALIFASLASLAERAQPKPPALIFPTRAPATNQPGPTSPPDATQALPPSGPQGKIAFVCQLFKLQAKDQICLINADGTGWRRLTQNDEARHFYPSISPDGKSVVFSSNMDGIFMLYEMSLDGDLTNLGNTVGFAPEISPAGTQIVYANSGEKQMIWIADRDGLNPRLLYQDAWDPTWSPDGSQVLFATTINGLPQLAVINTDGSGFRQVTNLPALRGRSDWSADGAHIVTYSGTAWQRELFMLNPDGSNVTQISPPGGNSQGPSFSPDGQWVAFTAYYNASGNNNGCEIYIMRINGENLTRLTENAYCDWQPRWGP